MLYEPAIKWIVKITGGDKQGAAKNGTTQIRQGAVPRERSD